MSNTNTSDFDEYAIYIHGVSDKSQSHKPQYEKLHNAILDQLPDDKKSAWSNTVPCYVEWGWKYPPESSTEDHRFLQDAQDKFAERVLPKIEEPFDPTINPARLLLKAARQMMLKGFSDMFYYVSEDGKSSVRAAVVSQIMKQLSSQLERASDWKPISITLLGHSAGSVIAFDFLFYLFNQENQEEPPPKFFTFDESLLRMASPSEVLEQQKKAEEFVEKLRQMAQQDKLRIRRLVTFGSPISMLAFRSNPVLKILESGERLDVSKFGLDRNPDVFGEPLTGPRWINLWDKDDIIAWPVEPLMKEQIPAVVRDVYTNVGNMISTAHNLYWNDKTVHREIAAHW